MRRLVHLVSSETRKLTTSPVLRLVGLLIILVPIAGGFLSRFFPAESQVESFLVNPAGAAAILGAICLASLTLYELDRLQRNGIGSLIEPVISAQTIFLVKTAALIIASAGIVLLAGLLNLPFAYYHLKDLFSLPLYLFVYLVILLPGLLFSILIASGLYQIFRRMDAAFAVFIAAVFVSLNSGNNYLTVWIQTHLSGYSNYLGSPAMNLAVWNRFLGAAAALAILTFGLLCTRRYHKNIWKSVILNSKRFILPGVLIVMIAGTTLLYRYEPNFDNTADIKYEQIIDKETNTASFMSIMQGPEINREVDLRSTNLTIDLDTRRQRLDGKAELNLVNRSAKIQTIKFELQPGYSVSLHDPDDQPVLCRKTTEGCYSLELAARADTNLIVEYSGKIQNLRLLRPSSYYIINNDYVHISQKYLWPQFQVNTDGNIINGTATAPDHLMLVTSGLTSLLNKNLETGTACWQFRQRGKSLELTGGPFNCRNISAGGIKIEFYYLRQQEAVVDSLDTEKVIEAAVNYFTRLLGPLDYTELPLKIVTINLAGGNAGSNICNVGDMIFNPDSFSNSSFEGTNGVEVLVHELCHQWWGVSTNVDTRIPWSPEGLTVFTTYRFLRDYYGKEYADKTCVLNWQSSIESLKRNFYYRHPEYLEIVPQKYLFSVVGMQNATVIYAQMSLQIYKAEQILGEDRFASALGKMFRRYKDKLTYDHFLRECGLTQEAISLE